MGTCKEQLDKAKWRRSWGKPRIRKWYKNQYNRWVRRISKQKGEEAPKKRQYRGYES
jgi:hypothetical protein